MSLESWNDTPTKQAILDFVAAASADGGCVDHRRRGVWHDGRARDAAAISRVAGGFFPRGLKRWQDSPNWLPVATSSCG
jgi:hypothetical protein